MFFPHSPLHTFIVSENFTDGMKRVSFRVVEGGGSVVGASYIIEREDVAFGVDLVRSGNF